MMKKYLVFAAAAALLLSAASCEKQEVPMTPQEQKEEISRISAKMDSMVDESALQDVKDISAYYTTTLSGYNSTAILFYNGEVLGLVDNMFKALPGAQNNAVEAKAETKSLDWNFSIGGGEFRANATNGVWEYVGAGSGDGIKLSFTDDKGRECYILVKVNKDYMSVMDGEKAAILELYVGDTKLVECTAACIYKGITELSASLSAVCGPLCSKSAVVSNNGEYAARQYITYSDNLVADSQVYATGVKFGVADNSVYSFGTIQASVNVMDKFLVSATVSASIPDIFFTDWSTSYVDKLQEYIDKNVSVDLYFAGHYGPQAQIRLRVDRSGLPLFGKVAVTPYIYFESDGSTCEFSSFFQSASFLPNLLNCLEELLGNISITL